MLAGRITLSLLDSSNVPKVDEKLNAVKKSDFDRTQLLRFKYSSAGNGGGGLKRNS